MKPKLIKLLSEVQNDLPVNMTSDFDVVAPFLAAAEQSYLLRYIGKEQFSALVTAYDETTEDEDLNQAIAYTQKVIANLGYALALPVLSLSIGSSGIQIQTNENAKQAFQWQVNDLKDALYNLGLTGLEDLLVFLQSVPGKFSAYTDSDEYKKQTQLLINTAVDFNDYFDIGCSRLIFQTMAYIVKRVESQVIEKMIGAEFLASLKQPGLSDKKIQLVVKYLKPGIAMITIAKALMERVISLENGRIGYNFSGRTENMKESQAASNQMVANTYQQLIDDANISLQDGMQYIQDNLEDMDGFTPPTPRRRFRITNDPCKGVFAV